VANKTFADVVKIKTFKTYKGDYELHLMVNNPLTIIKKWEKYKKVRKIIFHYEAMKDDNEVFELLNYIKKKKLQVGLAINPQTLVSKIIKFIPELDLIFLLGVDPGWGGQNLQSQVLNKAKRIRLQYPKVDIELDGGVNLENIPRIIQSGVNVIAAGSMIFNSPDIDKTLSQIKKYEEL